MTGQIKHEILELAAGVRDAVACSVDGEGFPAAKALFIAGREGISTFWFSTNTSSIRAGHWRERPKASIYLQDPVAVRGLLLTGRMEVLSDGVVKERFWHPGDEKYYPQGPTDPDYSILRFTAERGNYYHGLGKHLFALEEWGE